MQRFLAFIALLVCPATFAKDVGFKDGKFFLKVEIEWAKDRKSSDLFSFQLCPAQLPKSNTLCFNLAACTFARPELTEAIGKIEDEAVRKEFDTLLQGSYQTELTFQKFMKQHLALLGGIAEKKECVLITDLPKHWTEEKSDPTSKGADDKSK